jgi:hypothetical protein
VTALMTLVPAGDTRPAAIPAGTRKPRPGGRRLVDCQHCGRHRRHKGHGLCGACMQRWDAAGRPDEVPVPRSNLDRLAIAWEAHRAARQGRVDDYLILRDDCRLSRAEAAARLGVSLRTIERYEAQLRREATQ